MSEATDIIKKYGFCDSYFVSMKKICPQKYSMIFPDGNVNANSVRRYIDKVRNLVAKVHDIFYELQEHRLLQRFGKILVQYGLFSSESGAYVFFYNSFSYSEESRILKMRTSTVKKMEQIIQIYRQSIDHIRKVQ